MKSIFTKIGCFLSSTNKSALKKVGNDKFSIRKQIILGYAIFIPPIIAYFSLHHVFSLQIEDDFILKIVSGLGASVIFFLDFSTVFFLSIYQNKKLYLIRIGYSLILGLFLAIIATISLNYEHLNTLYQDQYAVENKYNEQIDILQVRINETDVNISEKRRNDRSPFLEILLRDDYRNEIEGLRTLINDNNLSGLFAEVSFLYEEIFRRENYFLGFQTILLLLIIMSFDIIPILLKIIGFETKYDIYLKINYYSINQNSFDKDYTYLLNDIFKIEIDNFDYQQSKARSKNMKLYYREIIEQLYYYSKITLLSDLFNSSIIIDDDDNNDSGDENNNGSKNKLQILLWAIALSVPEFVFLVFWLSYQQINNIVVYTSLFTTIFIANRAFSLYYSIKKEEKI